MHIAKGLPVSSSSPLQSLRLYLFGSSFSLYYEVQRSCRRAVLLGSVVLGCVHRKTEKPRKPCEAGEVHRFRFKAKPENKGKLHTVGPATRQQYRSRFGVSGIEETPAKVELGDLGTSTEFDGDAADHDASTEWQIKRSASCTSRLPGASTRTTLETSSRTQAVVGSSSA